ncbi:MAG: malonic semialdehyde reductase [Myxococcota bacterium]
MSKLPDLAQPADSSAPIAPIDPSVADLFLERRTHNAFFDRPVDEATLRRLYDLTRWGPTAANSQPLRVVFVQSAEAKERLRPTLAPGNVDKTMQAPVTAILAWDTRFYDRMPELFPARPQMRDTLAALPDARREVMAAQSAHLQGGYFILAARALGLDVGPMGGFDAAQVDAAFFPDGAWKSLLLVNLGYGDARGLFPRNPRLSFDDACRIA